MMAAKYKLDNLVAMVDFNKHSLTNRIQEILSLDPLKGKWIAFNCMAGSDRQLIPLIMHFIGQKMNFKAIF